MMQDLAPNSFALNGPYGACGYEWILTTLAKFLAYPRCDKQNKTVQKIRANNSA